MSADFTIADAPILWAQIVHGEAGAWSARAVLATGNAPTGKVSLVLPGLTLQSYVVSGGAFAERASVHLQGGAGGLGKLVQGQHYQVADARTVAGGLLSAAGEELDPQSDAGLLGTALPHYQHLRSTCGEALSALCAAIGARWWVEPAGTVRIGQRTYPAAAPEGLEELEVRPEERLVITAPTEEPPLPGTTIDDRRILAVTHTLEGARWRAALRYAA